MTIPQRFTTGDATFYVLVVSDDMGTADDENGDAIVWEHPFPEGTELRDVLKRQAHLDGRYGTSWIAECRIIPETKRGPAAVKESLTDREGPRGPQSGQGPVGVVVAPADARSEHVPPRFIPGPHQLAARVEAIEDGRPCPYIRSSDEGTSYCGLAEEISRPDKLDRLIAQDAATGGDSLVERVQAAIGHTYPDDARAAIRVVAAWLRVGRMLHAAELLELEAGRG